LNAFHDYEWNFNHSRASVGGELRWSGLDFYVNKYWALSGKHTADNSASERPLDGFDIELTAQVPYLPWARARARRVWWDSVDAAEDVKVWGASLEMDLLQNLTFEAGLQGRQHRGRRLFRPDPFQSFGQRQRPAGGGEQQIHRRYGLPAARHVGPYAGQGQARKRNHCRTFLRRSRDRKGELG
jgi:hypothetical protein